MKFTQMRPALAAALALTLAACGGGKATFPINGVIINHLGEPLGTKWGPVVLSTNGMDLTVPAGATKFSFPNVLEYGDVYNVVVKTQPPHQTCEVLNGEDTAGRLAAITVRVECTTNQRAIGGTIKGLTADGLVLANGSTGGIYAPAKSTSDTTYTFSQGVEYGVTYGVVVQKQPTGLTCTVANGTGVMGDLAVTNIDVTCVPAT